jgi:signal peptidase I
MNPTLRRTPAHAPRRLLVVGVGLALVAGWWFALAPTSIGGPTAFVVVHGTSMEPQLHTGDLVMTHAADEYRVGDVVAFRADGGHVIHRLVRGSAETGWRTKGDNRRTEDSWTVTPSDVLGRAVLTVPGGFAVLKTYGPWAAALLAFALVAVPTRRRAPRPSEAEPVKEPA